VWPVVAKVLFCVHVCVCVDEMAESEWIKMTFGVWTWVGH